MLYFFDAVQMQNKVFLFVTFWKCQSSFEHYYAVIFNNFPESYFWELTTKNYARKFFLQNKQTEKKIRLNK